MLILSIYGSFTTRKDRLSDRCTVAVKYRKYSLYDFLQDTLRWRFESLSVIFTYYRFQCVKTFFTKV